MVIGFEPDPTIFPILERNIERNRCRNVRLIQAALAGSAGTVNLISDSSRLSFVGNPSHLPQPHWRKFAVRSVTLLDYADREVDFLKMNIEGAERDVLVGLGPKVRQIRQMVFEYHHDSTSPQNLHEILEFLHRNRFEYVIHSYARYTNPGAHPPFQSANNSHTLAVFAHRLS